MLTEQIKEKAEQCREEIIQFRRELHRHPEVSMEEYETSHKIAEKLRSPEGMEALFVRNTWYNARMRPRRTCCVAFRQCNDSVKAAQPVFRSREICIPAGCCVRFCLQSAARILGEEHVKLDTNPHLG